MSGMFRVGGEAYDDFMGRYSARLAPLFADFFGARGRVLDVGAGTGMLTRELLARGCDVTAAEPSPEFCAALRERFPAIEVAQTGAEELPFEDGAFDAVASTFGAMFSPDQSRTASEMLRVCRSGGRIGLANWTPDGFIGQLFKTIGKHLPPPAGLKSPALWGTREWLDKAFGAHASALKAEPRHFVFRYRSPQHFVDVFRDYYGPMLKAFEALNAAGRKVLSQDVIDLVGRFNKSGDGAMVVPGEYLEVVVTRR